MHRFSYFLVGLLLSLAVWQCSSEDNQQGTTADAASKPAATKIPSFQTLTANPADQARRVTLTGRILPSERLQIVAEVQGKVLPSKKILNEGISYRKGDLMIHIEDDQYRLNLQAQKSQFQTLLVRNMSKIKLDFPEHYDTWVDYLKSFDPKQLLPELPEVEDEKLNFFLSANDFYSSYYNIKSAEELLPKYQIRAPFTGIITQGSLVPGSVINPGAPIATLSRTDLFELKAPVSSADIKRFKVGQQIKLVHNNTGQTWTGRVHRIGGTMDPSTQSAPVFIRLSGRDLREGMFLEATLETDAYEKVVVLPLSAMNRNNQVHVIQDSVVVLQQVNPLHFDQDQVWVGGLEGGEKIIVEPLTGPIVGIRAVPKS